MTAKPVTTALLVAAALAISGTAGADEDTRIQKPYSIDANVGVGTPFGILTASRDWHLYDFINVSTGVGLGLGGVQVSVMPTVQHRMSKNATARLGFGLSGGPYHWYEGPFCFSDDCAEKEAAFAFWGRVDATLEYRWESGWHLGPYLGFARMLNADELECTGDDEMVSHCESGHTDDGWKRLYTGLTLGRAF